MKRARRSASSSTSSPNWTPGSLKVYLALAVAALTWWLWRWLEGSGMIDGKHGPATLLLVLGIPMLAALFLYDPVTDFFSSRRAATQRTKSVDKEERPGG